MKNGCPRCEKLPNDKVCDICELEMARSTLDNALRWYSEATNKILANYDKALDIMIEKETEK